MALRVNMEAHQRDTIVPMVSTIKETQWETHIEELQEEDKFEQSHLSIQYQK